jgi:hypothetical protein
MTKDATIAPAQMLEVKQILGPELCLAFDIMNSRLGRIDDDLPASATGSIIRRNAELREARKIIHTLKHPDSDSHVSRDNMAWALSYVFNRCIDTPALEAVATVMRHAALLMGVDIVEPQDIPRALAYQIENAVKVLSSRNAPEIMLSAAVN